MSAASRRLRRVRRNDSGPRLTLAQFKMIVREQFFMLLLDQEAALAAIPKLLPTSADERRSGFAAIREVLSASGEISGEVARRLKRVGQLFGVDATCRSARRRLALPFDPTSEGVVTPSGSIRSDAMNVMAADTAKSGPTANTTA